ncbi:MAG: transglycosylase, partial [Ponticaulis sp.]|nr:transglycosylase [Ponticaulis sp.]
MKRLSCLLSGLIFFVFCQTAFAIEAPSKKPPNPFRSSVLNRSDAERLYLGLQAARDSDWNAVRSYRDGISDPTARKLLFWRMASSSLSDADFQTLDRALSDLEGWPGTRELRIRAEEEISASTLPPSEQVNWLEASGPISGEGKLALGKAYMALGRTSDAEEMIKSAWHGHAFLISRQSEIARTYAEILDPEDHVKRTDYLLWTSQRSAAQAMKSYLSPGWDRLVDARIGLAVRAGNVDGLINAVPSELQMNPGLLYERSYWRRRKDRWEDAREPLLQINPDGLPTVALGKIWDEKNLHLRRAIRDDEWQDAYMLSSTHGLTECVDFANGEFYAGWVALRFLDRPQDALRHFQTLENGVGSAISLSRAQFWVGEAYSALGQRAEAEAAWRRAAEHITYFYAQRAAERLGQTTITLPAVVIPTEDERARFENLELVRVLRMLAEAGEDYQFRRISYELDDQLTTIAEYELLFELAES